MAKDENKIAELIEMGLDVQTDLADGRMTDAEVSDTERETAKLDSKVCGDLGKLVGEVGVLAVLEALRDAADMAADAHDGMVSQRTIGRLRAFSKHLGDAMLVVSS